MNGRIDAHRHLVRVLVGDALVHVEDVALALANRVLAEAGDGVRKIQVHPKPAWTDPAPLIAHRLGVSRRHIARYKIAKARIAPLEIIIALAFRNLIRRPLVALLQRYPDAPIVA